MPVESFVGGLATIFPNTAVVESDFSILGWEIDEYSKVLTDLTSEGAMHCKRFEVIQQLA